MQRTRLLVLVAVVTLAVVLAAGARLLGRLDPESLRSELQAELQGWLGIPVEVASARLVLAGGVGIQASDLRAGEGEDPEIRIRTARALLDLRSVLFGRIEVRRLELAGVHARLERGPEGWSPPAVARLLGGSTEAEERRLGRSLLEAARLVLRVPPAAPALAIEDAELVVRTGPAAAAGRLALTDVSVRLAQRVFGRGHRLQASAHLAEHGSGGRLVADATLREGRSELELVLERVDLAALAPLASRLPALRGVGGTASGVLRWRQDGAGHHDLQLQLEGRSLALRSQVDERRLELEVPGTRLEVDALAKPDRISISRLALASGEMQLDASGTLALPLRETAATDLVVSARDLRLLGSRDALLALLPEGGNGLRDVAAGIEAGRLVRMDARGSGITLDDWRRLARDPLAAWPVSLALELELEDAALQLPGAGRLTDLSGSVARTPERLDLRGFRATLDGRALPRLELRVRGPEHLRGARRGERDPPPSLAGQAAVWRWIQAQSKTSDEGRRWSRVEVQADYLDHPALPWPISWVRAVLEPGEGRTAVRIESARVGDIPVRGQGSFGGSAPGSLVFTLDASAPEDAPAVEVGPGVWARGRVNANLRRLGRFPAERVTARFRGVGSRLDFRSAKLNLQPSGTVSGDVRLDLAHVDHVPFDAELQVENAPAPIVAEGLKLNPEGMTGTVQAGALLRGRLRAHESLAAHLEGPVSFHVRNGQVRRTIPAMLAIATTSEVINPFRARESVPFAALDAEIRLLKGRLEAEQISLDGPAIRMVATGSVKLGEDPHDLEGVVGVFFFPTVDAAIGRVPVLSRLLLGPDKNLVSGYFALTGTWERPRAEMIPIKTLASGPVNLVVALPGFVHAGLKRLQRLVPSEGAVVDPVPGPEARPAPEAPPAPGSDPPAAEAILP